MTKRVVVADDNTLIRQIMAFACARQGLDVVGLAETSRALADLCQEEAPDVVIAGSPFDGQPIDRCLDELVHFGCRALIVSYDPSPSRMIGALGHGASGYLLSDSRTEDVATAAAVVAAGGVALHPVAAGLVVHQWRRYRAGPCVPDPTQRSLTPREQEILTAMVDGLAAKSIARMLGVSLKTVENHKTRIFAKLGARTQAHAVSIATAEGVTCARVDSDGPDSANSAIGRRSEIAALARHS